MVADMVADMQVDMVADMEEDKVADMVANPPKKIDIEINMVRELVTGIG